VTPQFQQGAFVVLKGRVREVTPMKLVTIAKGEKFASSFKAMLDAFGELELHNAIQTVNTQVRI